MNEKRKITLKDIAKELKLSSSTVSRALNGYPSLSEETIQLVKEYAAKHHNVPNTMAVNFRKNQTSILGMIVQQIDRARIFHKILNRLLRTILYLGSKI